LKKPVAPELLHVIIDGRAPSGKWPATFLFVYLWKKRGFFCTSLLLDKVFGNQHFFEFQVPFGLFYYSTRSSSGELERAARWYKRKKFCPGIRCPLVSIYPTLCEEKGAYISRNEEDGKSYIPRVTVHNRKKKLLFLTLVLAKHDPDF